MMFEILITFALGAKVRVLKYPSRYPAILHNLDIYGRAITTTKTAKTTRTPAFFCMYTYFSRYSVVNFAKTLRISD
ncbi:MAG: hypothetical protein SAK29_06710 [Scytonema sp. PMC 1069.18]|nr:hypothetical protein [Scytonema sp. PMC 1069.18]MEC4884032.1 hypothetical protein [Scytonema sp. PMC 1070.18]